MAKLRRQAIAVQGEKVALNDDQLLAVILFISTLALSVAALAESKVIVDQRHDLNLTRFRLCLAENQVSLRNYDPQGVDPYVFAVSWVNSTVLLREARNHNNTVIVSESGYLVFLEPNYAVGYDARGELP